MLPPNNTLGKNETIKLPYIFPKSLPPEKEENFARGEGIRKFIIQEGLHYMHIWSHNIFPQISQASIIASKICNNENRSIHLGTKKSEGIWVMHRDYMIPTGRPLPIL